MKRHQMTHYCHFNTRTWNDPVGFQLIYIVQTMPPEGLSTLQHHTQTQKEDLKCSIHNDNSDCETGRMRKQQQKKKVDKLSSVLKLTLLSIIPGTDQKFFFAHVLEGYMF